MPDLKALQAFHGTSGDEGRLADHLERRLRRDLGSGGRRLERLGDTLVAVKGSPRLALFAHLDTVGYSVGYGRGLVPIGAAQAEDGDLLWAEIDREAVEVEARERARGGLAYRGERKLERGVRLAYRNAVRSEGGRLRGAYLDNRLGVTLALHLLEAESDLAVAFTADEEHAGKGALLAGNELFRRGIGRALICDMTWETEQISLGGGPVVSLRDAFLPRQRWLDRVVAAAVASGIGFQREVEASGSSDGGTLAQSAVPIDWVFVGVPIRGNHGREEQAAIADVADAWRLFRALIGRL